MSKYDLPFKVDDFESYDEESDPAWQRDFCDCSGDLPKIGEFTFSDMPDASFDLHQCPDCKAEYLWIGYWYPLPKNLIQERHGQLRLFDMADDER